MKTIWRFLVAFLMITVGVAVATVFFGVEFGRANYWNYHGVLFLGLLAMFPRLTLLLSSVPAGGLLWWASWIFAPRLLAAVLATLAYWNQNKILVILAWWVALGGESTEKYMMVRRTRSSRRGQGYDQAKWVKADKV
jgi:hypothetical protein